MQFKVLGLISLMFIISSCSLIESDICDQKTALDKGTSLMHKKFPRSMEDQNPIKIYDREGLWHIKGTLPPNYAGGVPHVKLDRQTCRLVEIYHTQ
ncbi:NTF2 fold immunity protein [Colwellia sp. RE-S-Sl-9]